MKTNFIIKLIFSLFLFLVPNLVAASSLLLDMTSNYYGLISVFVFFIAYIFVVGEDFFHMRKSKPVLLASGIIWVLIGFYCTQVGKSQLAEEAFNYNLTEYAQLLLFLIVAMSYVNAMEERGVFDFIRKWMIDKKFDLYKLFWFTGVCSFFISSVANNLTTAMLMCAIVLKMAPKNNKYINLSCINIIIASNAGGAFSPFGDITTLMVWQAGLVDFNQFFQLLVPSIVNFVVPACILSTMIEKHGETPAVLENTKLKRGAKRIVVLFLLTILTSVLCHSWFSMPPVLGMMTGLAYLKLFAFYLRKSLELSIAKNNSCANGSQKGMSRFKAMGDVVPFDVFDKIARAEWDTLLFFYGVVMCVGGLGFMGYLGLISDYIYSGNNNVIANVAVGVLSAIIDNIPVMYAVIKMNPSMDLTQWLLVTMTAGVGGSLLSVGSAAGVALMGQTKGVYSFMSHLRLAWIPMIGYILSIFVHLLISGYYF